MSPKLVVATRALHRLEVWNLDTLGVLGSKALAVGPGVTIAVPMIEGMDDRSVIEGGHAVRRLHSGVRGIVMGGAPELAAGSRADVIALIVVFAVGGSIATSGDGLGLEGLHGPRRAHLVRDDALEILVHLHGDDGAVQHLDADRAGDRGHAREARLQCLKRLVGKGM